LDFKTNCSTYLGTDRHYLHLCEMPCSRLIDPSYSSTVPDVLLSGNHVKALSIYICIPCVDQQEIKKKQARGDEEGVGRDGDGEWGVP
jgi:hypothetical protein